jgi:hypothetical protein
MVNNRTLYEKILNSDTSEDLRKIKTLENGYTNITHKLHDKDGKFYIRKDGNSFFVYTEIQ